MSQIKKKKRYIKWLAILAILAGIIAGSIFVMWKMIQPKASPLAGDSPTIVSSDTKITVPSSSHIPAVTSPAILVSDTGAPQWVQIKSKGSDPKFQDLSEENLTIYKVHNPKILKVATSISSPYIPISQVIGRYPNTMIMNTSSFLFGTTPHIVGFQINNGKLFQDWSANQYAFIINKDGSTEIVDSSTPASQLIQAGAEQSYSYGAALVRNGKIIPNSSTSVNWEIHTFIGADKDNNIILIISNTNGWNQEVLTKLYEQLHLESLVVLDGGGSSQMSFMGKIIFPSQDDRQVPDYIVLK